MPGSAKSPYKELGVDAKARPRMVRAKAKDRGLHSGVNDKDLGHDRHDWNPMSTRAMNADLQPCRRCRQPRFAVDGLPCDGNKNRR